MSNALTIFRRDLAAYFTSPIGYIFIMVFVTISVGLYITTFFTFPMADMRPYFGNLPLMLCIFIPAITMRVWAEERKENTWEMLLTFPMKSWELVIGKFAACLVFFAIALGATVTLPAMLFTLGNPDPGAILAGYFGTFLLGGLFLALGIFFSGFFKDQILAFIVTLLSCFGIFMLGTNFIAAYLDDFVPGLGTLLIELVGLSGHFGTFTRGIIEMADIVYFLAWTGVFLLLNIVYIEGRFRPGARLIFATATTISISIGLLLNWLITDMSLLRFDMTEDKIYTVSEASTRILRQTDTPVQVKLYITPRGGMPTGMTSLERDITDKLDELRVASGGALQYSVVHLEVANAIQAQEDFLSGEENEGEEKVLEERMLDKGIRPFSVQAMSEDQVTNKLVYSSIGVAYKDRKEEIIPQVMPGTLPDLEYRLVSTIFKLIREEKPIAVLVAPKEAINIPPELRQMYRQMGQEIPESDDSYIYLEQILNLEKYEVKRVDLTQSSPLPETYDTLIVVNPRELNDRQRWEIARALRSGKSVIMAVQNYEWDYTLSSGGTRLNRREENPQVNDLLQHYGVTVDDDLLMDVNHVPLRVQSGGNTLAALLGGGQTVNLPTHILVNNSSMDQETSITSRLSPIFYLWGTSLTIDDAKVAETGLDVLTLISTTENAWKVDKDSVLTAESFEQPETGLDTYPLMAMVTGQFPDPYADQDRPAWPIDLPQPGQPLQFPPPEEGDAPEVVPAPGKLILLGCSEMFRKDFLQAANLDLFMNSVDALTLGDDLVHVRGKKPIDRLIDMPDTGTRRLWKFINYGLANTVIAVMGIVIALVRRRSRNAYTLSYSNANK